MATLSERLTVGRRGGLHNAQMQFQPKAVTLRNLL
jgi:hypothetical protein